jgi:catalase (peroxidase I)
MNGNSPKVPQARINGWLKIANLSTLIPDAHDPSKKHPPMMTTADLSLRFDSAYEKICTPFSSRPTSVCRCLCSGMV